MGPMFNLGFSEMIILGVIILVFVGPKELPEMARMIGRFLNEFRRSTDALKDEWHRSTEDMVPRKLIGELKSDIEQTMSGQGNSVSTSQTIAPPPAPPSAPPPVGEAVVSPAGEAAPTVAAPEPAPPQNVVVESAAGPAYPPDGKYEK